MSFGTIKIIITACFVAKQLRSSVLFSVLAACRTINSLYLWVALTARYDCHNLQTAFSHVGTRNYTSGMSLQNPAVKPEIQFYKALGCGICDGSSLVGGKSS